MARKRKRSKKKSFAWRALLWLLRQLGRFLRYIYRKIKVKVKEKNRERKLKKKPVYNKEANFAGFDVVSTVSGKFTETEHRLMHESFILLIFGRRGSGKSVLGFKLLENIRAKTGRKCYVLGVPQEVLPKWVRSVNSIESVSNGSAILVDEGAIEFSARESMDKKNKQLSKLLAIARHKDLSVFFITQNTAMIDKNILSLVDLLMIKQGSLLQQEMERKAIQKFYAKANSAISGLEGNKRQYVYVIDSDFEGVLRAPLPSFWSQSVSKSRA